MEPRARDDYSTLVIFFVSDRYARCWCLLSKLVIRGTCVLNSAPIIGFLTRLVLSCIIIDKLHICQDSSGWCPEPHCHGPLAPPSCHSRSGSSSGGSSSSSGGSSGTSTSASSSSTSDVTYADAQDAVDYDNNGEAIYADYQEDSGNFATVVDGTQGQRNGGDSQVHHNQLYAFLAAATVAGVVGAILMKKNVSQ